MFGGAEINKKRRFHTLCEDKIVALLPKKTLQGENTQRAIDGLTSAI